MLKEIKRMLKAKQEVVLRNRTRKLNCETGKHELVYGTSEVRVTKIGATHVEGHAYCNGETLAQYGTFRVKYNEDCFRLSGSSAGTNYYWNSVKK